MYVSSVSYRTSHVICDKLAPPLITVQHLSSPLLSCGRTHTYTYTRTLSLCTGYGYPGVVYSMTPVLGFLDFLIFPLIAPLCVCIIHICVLITPYHLFSSVLSPLHEVQLVSKDFRRLISWKLVGCDVAIITEISKVILDMRFWCWKLDFFLF